MALFAEDPEAGVQGLCGIAGDLTLGAPEAQFVLAHREPHSLLLAGGEPPGGAARALVDIELDNFVSELRPVFSTSMDTWSEPPGASHGSAEKGVFAGTLHDAPQRTSRAISK